MERARVADRRQRSTSQVRKFIFRQGQARERRVFLWHRGIVVVADAADLALHVQDHVVLLNE